LVFGCWNSIFQNYKIKLYITFWK